MTEDREAVEEFFDPASLAELEGLAAIDRGSPGRPTPASSLDEKLSDFLRAPGAPTPLTEEAFVMLPNAGIIERSNVLVDTCRGAPRPEPAQAVENFIVFFQALVPTLSEEGGRDIKRFFFRLAPTLIQIAFHDFADDGAGRAEGRAALTNLETILIEISNVRLAPSERELVFRNIDQMASFIAAGAYAMANEVISSQLLGIIRGNKLTRALFRLMEVEVSIQVYLKERFGYLTPQIQVPEDAAVLNDYGPLRVLEEECPDGQRRWFLQVHIPEIPILRDIVLRLVDAKGAAHDFRLDALGSVELNVPPGHYGLGLVYQPEPTHS
jgi:hypothetical protein